MAFTSYVMRQMSCPKTHETNVDFHWLSASKRTYVSDGWSVTCQNPRSFSNNKQRLTIVLRVVMLLLWMCFMSVKRFHNALLKALMSCWVISHRVPWNRFAISTRIQRLALKSHWNFKAIAKHQLCNCFEIAKQLQSTTFAITLKLLCNYREAALQLQRAAV